MPLSAAWRPEAADHLLDEDVVELLGRRTAHVAKIVKDEALSRYGLQSTNFCISQRACGHFAGPPCPGTARGHKRTLLRAMA
jgi:hypothetical protein